jgi:hypothetical protein
MIRRHGRETVPQHATLPEQCWFDLCKAMFCCAKHSHAADPGEWHQLTFGGTIVLTETFQSAALVLVWRSMRSSQGWALVASKSKRKLVVQRQRDSSRSRMWVNRRAMGWVGPMSRRSR